MILGSYKELGNFGYSFTATWD